ncbi:hypothetical protein ACHQM5_017936 [Ranunculus cassubicifolius]
MEGGPRNKETCPQLLDLWLMKGDENMKKNMGEVAEEKKLELRLAPPGEDWEDNPKAYGSFSGNPKAWLINDGGVNQNQPTDLGYPPVRYTDIGHPPVA